ncbi:Fe-S cluster biogenesis protein NfuA [Flavobacterium aciduliphilum]|uniref:Fe-S cluster biogenesis protein NfuA n=2 Tax=Flavobacterium aciduliphilum TaxID=1101402 RepID=A0A328YMK6_9FLAO|nr:Fe-S cluster biogenesis protein NfuA [Flavobacterium aciduliphilum]
MKVTIKKTQNPTILKFEFPDFITQNESFEFKNIDEAQNSPLAQKLFYLPFVKTVYISGNFIAIERFSIVDWEDVKEAVADQIVEFISNGGKIFSESISNLTNKVVTIYGETTPNPATLKFVTNKKLVTVAAEYKSIEETTTSPLANELFQFPFVKEVFIDENYISITKNELGTWDEFGTEMRVFIKQYIDNGGVVLDESLYSNHIKQEKQQIKNFENLDTTSQQIINILEEYVKPAVAADGGNILFDSYDSNEKRIKVILQGSCNGCPSSTFTLKNGIENMLKNMLNDDAIIVEALNS